MHVVTNFKAFKAKILNLNNNLQDQFVDALEKELNNKVFVDLMVNYNIVRTMFANNESQIVLTFNDDEGIFITNYCIIL
jgi:hypothetical protein